MSTTSGLDVEIDEAIRKQPGLLDAVEDASRFLESRIRKADIPDLRDMQLSWGFNPLEKGWVEASLRVWWRDSGIGGCGGMCWRRSHGCSFVTSMNRFGNWRNRKTGRTDMADSPTKLIRETQQEVKVLAERVDGLRHELSQLSLPELRDRMSLLAERLAVTEDRVNKLEKTKAEAEKRHWQFVYIVLGAALALLSSLLVNLLLLLVKK
jgi:hypothetical protein